MSVAQKSDMMIAAAKECGDAIRAKDFDRLQVCFAEDCEIELFGHRVRGKAGVRKWYNWMFNHMKELDFEQVHVLVDGNVLLEEYILNGVIHTGRKIKSRQMRSVAFEDGKIKTFRLYMDRLQFADSVAGDFASKMVIKKFEKVSLKGMLQ